MSPSTDAKPELSAEPPVTDGASELHGVERTETDLEPFRVPDARAAVRPVKSLAGVGTSLAPVALDADGGETIRGPIPSIALPLALPAPALPAPALPAPTAPPALPEPPPSTTASRHSLSTIVALPPPAHSGWPVAAALCAAGLFAVGVVAALASRPPSTGAPPMGAAPRVVESLAPTALYVESVAMASAKGRFVGPACGKRTIKVGAAQRTVDVPCGVTKTP